MAWVTGSNVNIARRDGAGAGDYSSALFSGGVDSSYSIVTEKNNGNVWAASGNLSAARRAASGFGTQSAAVAVAGYNATNDPSNPLSSSEHFNGTSWSAGGGLSLNRYNAAACGTQSAGLILAGVAPIGAPPVTDTSEEYNGTSWSAGGTVPSLRFSLSACGTQTAGLTFGGQDEDNVKHTTAYKYNGTSFSSTGSLNTARYQFAGSGTQSNGYAIGGYDDSTQLASCELFGGSTWATSDNLNTARRLASAATNTSASSYSLVFGGYDGSNVASTEHFFAGTLVLASPNTLTATIPTHAVPTITTVSALTGVATIPAPTVSVPAIINASPLVGTVTIPDPGVQVVLILANALTITATVPAPTVSLPSIVVVSPLTSTFAVLDPYVIALQKSIMFGAYNFPCSKTVYCKIVDDTETVIQDWTTTGVVETVVDVTADKSIYSIRTNKVNENFQGKIMWKTNDTTPLTAVEIINVYSSYVDILQNRVTSRRATNLDNLDRANSESLAAADYTAPDNAGIAAIKAKTDTISWADITRLLGLTLENHVEDDIVRDGSGNKISSVLYLYDSAANATTHDKSTGKIASYNVLATYSGGRMTEFKVLKN